MDEQAGLRADGRWRMAVWALRLGYLGLLVAIAGLLVILLGSTPWVVAVGVITWLVAAAVMMMSTPVTAGKNTAREQQHRGERGNHEGGRFHRMFLGSA